MTLNGYSAHRRVAEFIEESEEGTEKQGLHVVSTFIRKENTIYVFHGFTDLDHVSSYKPAFLRTMNNFRNLTDRNRLNVQPTRLRIRKISRRETLQEALKRLGVKDSDLQSMAILNGMHLHDTVEPNTIIKMMGK